MSDARQILLHLDTRIRTRVSEIIEKKPNWPCGKGCDACCRSLGEIPHATAAEWERLFAGVRGLPKAVQAEIEARIEDLAAAPNVQPVVCPFLDLINGACLVYEHRLLACRAYGFFASRDAGRWCEQIESMADEEKQNIVYGHFDSLLDEARRALGESVSVNDWWTR